MCIYIYTHTCVHILTYTIRPLFCLRLCTRFSWFNSWRDVWTNPCNTVYCWIVWLHIPLHIRTLYPVRITPIVVGYLPPPSYPAITTRYEDKMRNGEFFWIHAVPEWRLNEENGFREVPELGLSEHLVGGFNPSEKYSSIRMAIPILIDEK